ncbi:hypothetical protein AAHA92_25017 [Salvia divinorum]|uniref:Uncharacterized protein n=1 Tax=Salvia divinorum TaxID=28513 RepID=A0ABD1G9B1_SALDI
MLSFPIPFFPKFSQLLSLFQIGTRAHQFPHHPPSLSTCAIAACPLTEAQRRRRWEVSSHRLQRRCWCPHRIME